MISVLLPVYNGEKYLRQSIQSILNQTYKDFEFLIVDDGSTDNTVNVAKSFDDNRIKYIKKEHTGLADSLNYGLKIAKYDWVARMDADDLAHPYRLEKQVALLDGNPNVVVFTKTVFFTEDKLKFKYEQHLNSHEIKENLILHSPIPHPTVLYNRHFILENKGYNEKLKLAEDYELWLRIKEKTKFIFVNETLLFMRYSNLSMSRKDENNTNTTIYNIQDKYYSNLGKKFNLKSVKLQNEYRGWREYFFGNPKFARKYWLKNYSNLLKYRIMLAFLISFFHINNINAFKKSNIKLRLKFLLNDLLRKNKEIRKKFNETIRLLKI